MSPARIYRFSIWLPLIVPVVLIVVMNVLLKGMGMPKPSGYLDVALELVASSGLYGGLPYVVLALWATWWIRGRPEPDIRRMMFLAPLLMVVVFAAACLIVGAVADRMRVWVGVAKLGIGTIIPLGYAYVGCAVLLRRWLGPPPVDVTTS
ncbi:MAG: hypothetical protein ABI051_18775 [Vicinamibacterales bacterium]